MSGDTHQGRQYLTRKGTKKEKYKATAENDTERWKELCQEVGSMEKPYSFRRSYIVIVGTGIQSITHFTLETLSEIKTADDVFYCTSDHLTDLFIKKLRPDAYDMHVLYSDEKPTSKTHIQMAEVCLHQARKGRQICVVFHGHPSIYSAPTQRILQIAKLEEINTKILAAVSTVSCLVTDLGINTFSSAIQAMDATDVLLRDRRINTNMHLILHNAGSIGDVGFQFEGQSSRDNLIVLVRKLQDIYGDDYEFTHYIPSQLSVFKPYIKKAKLSNFLETEVLILCSLSVFYFLPKDHIDAEVMNLESFGEFVGEFKPLEFQDNVQDESELSELLTNLSLNPTFLIFCEDNEYPRLRNHIERKALASKNSHEIRQALKPVDGDDVKPAVRFRKQPVQNLKDNNLPKEIKQILILNDFGEDWP